MRPVLMGLCILFLLGVVGCQQLEVWDKRGVSRFQSAYAGFLGEAARLNCLRAEHVEYLASSRGWRVEKPDPLRLPMNDQTGQADTLRLHVQPPMPLAKEPGIGFRFDANGCWIRP